MTVLLLAALLPPLFLVIRVYQTDAIEPEPVGLMVRLFLLGMLAVLPAIVLETLGERILLHGLMSGSGPLPRNVVENFIVVGLVEEGCKRFFLKRTTWHHPAFDYCFDGIVYAVAVSLGFAALENIGYVFQYGLQTALLRAVTSIPGHCIFGIFMGHFYGMAKTSAAHGDRRRERSMMGRSLWVPVPLHGFYDITASSKNEWVMLAFFLYLVSLDVIALRSIRKYAREDRHV